MNITGSLQPMSTIGNVALNSPETIVQRNVSVDAIHDLSPFSTVSQYTDDKWTLDQYYPLLNLRPNQRMLDFSGFEEDIKQYVKAYTYSRLISNTSLDDLYRRNTIIKRFFKDCHIKNLSQMNAKHIEEFYSSLVHQDITNNHRYFVWKSLYFFLQHIGNPLYKNMDLYNIRYQAAQFPNDDKYISDYVADQFDKLMFTDTVPDIYRLMYWSLRLYPGRGTETFSYKTDCISHLHDDIYILSTRVFKTAGTQEGVPRILLIDTSEPMQKLFYGLLIAQCSVADSITAEGKNPDHFLFEYYAYRYKNGKYSKTSLVSSMSTHTANGILKRLAERYDIRDEDGNIAIITTHMFRHNASTDRVESHIFRPIDLRPMTLHANEQMFNKNYHNKSIAKQVEQTHEINRLRGNNVLLFKGKIINSDNPAVFAYV